MNPIVDTLMVIFFVLFMIFIFRGYHIQRLKQVEEEMGDESRDEKKKSHKATEEPNNPPK